MFTVATGLDIPIKLVSPRLAANFHNAGCSMLGLGDILIPGIFIGFMTRFGKEVVKSNVYFLAAMISYSLGLLACGVALFVYKSA